MDNFMMEKNDAIKTMEDAKAIENRVERNANLALIGAKEDVARLKNRIVQTRDRIKLELNENQSTSFIMRFSENLMDLQRELVSAEEKVHLIQSIMWNV